MRISTDEDLVAEMIKNEIQFRKKKKKRKKKDVNITTNNSIFTTTKQNVLENVDDEEFKELLKEIIMEKKKTANKLGRKVNTILPKKSKKKLCQKDNLENSCKSSVITKKTNQNKIQECNKHELKVFNVHKVDATTSTLDDETLFLKSLVKKIMKKKKKATEVLGVKNKCKIANKQHKTTITYNDFKIDLPRTKNAISAYHCKTFEHNVRREVLPVSQHPESLIHWTADGANGKYFCRFCFKQFKYSSSLIMHENIHARHSILECNICSKSFVNQLLLAKHNRTHIIYKKFKCKVCDRAFEHKPMLREHIKLHTGDRPFKCTKCNKTFVERSSLRKHHRTHTGERPYQCNICGSRFSRNFVLTTHYRVHTGERPYTCDVCGHAFATKVTLSVHYRLHTGEMPFACGICSKKFRYSSAFKKHIKTQHNTSF